ncbi:MAG TPA: M28 family peptidase [Candidatus Lustribacter sp.]|nr:M28 family peptidase [Candidatus Lustribacter sp.]
MKALRVLGVACACVLLAAAPPRLQIYGFSLANSNQEFPLEDRFLDIPSAAGALDAAAALALLPHYAGSNGDYKLAMYVRDKFKSFGFDASLETFTARIDVPEQLSLALVPTGVLPVSVPAYVPLADRKKAKKQAAAAQPKGVKAEPGITLDLRELPDPNDPDTVNPAVGLPFIAGSADGSVTAPLSYAGHGMPADYALLDTHGIDPKGAILLIRLGSDTRGGLVRRAQAHGALGVILYDDPAEDGAARGATYPTGPWRPLNSVQRGSVGEGITIPVLPISANNARTLLLALKGPTAPRPWTGGLPVPYPFARGPASVHMTVKLKRRTTNLYNTIGTLHGTLPGQELVVGGQRDAWVYGIGSSGGGTVTLLEMARGLGFLASTGWTPSRTIVLAAWDGEQLGSYGSLAYLKRHGDELSTTSVAYLNTEPPPIGRAFGANAVAAIAPTIADATQVVPDPARPGGTIYDRYAFRTRGALPPIDRGNGGIDPAPFLFGAGTPSASATFYGPFGVYNSSYDTLQFARSIVDPDFELHRTTAQIYGIAVLRLANAEAIPYHFSAYVPLMQTAVRTLSTLARARKVNLDVRGLETSIGKFGAAAARQDAATKRVATTNAPDREMEAARILDLATYGIEGASTVAFPDVVRAIQEGDQNAVDLAVARARTTIERSGTLIAQQ